MNDDITNLKFDPPTFKACALDVMDATWKERKTIIADAIAVFVANGGDATDLEVKRQHTTDRGFASLLADGQIVRNAVSPRFFRKA